MYQFVLDSLMAPLYSLAASQGVSGKRSLKISVQLLAFSFWLLAQTSQWMRPTPSTPRQIHINDPNPRQSGMNWDDGLEMHANLG